ncbi:DODA-type extradiol aromatic ring-opening family dioxygenase [Commensalibacter papalotli (ex Servin-Garciduenas et al. 2014)]|uniref:Extradiol ring-cleavage dioxygenase class III protein subunit B n=1 Tax=Commensalibacter papalotli (ex Servin-Garciduenas et al. 2014) TaxID=1208583 RepID=W7DTP0_9PROT|nr:class III extradiol ring-cleavage dioxygenase [Commensalibacter papalotli (ex Servin-Garciduenas et al. 2014)]EUK17618.1 extradiol ring-cleavage dioxygenase class III protein subunit B [Commensalibacter papalotli (ex Servin-Garciduenas et al. 2014)]
MKRQPIFYIPHGGGPCFFMDDPHNVWTNMGNFLNKIPYSLPQTPDSIVIISGHWENMPIKIHAADKPSLFYDYYDFPPHTYELTYPASGNPQLAEKIQQLFQSQHIQAELEYERGWDHGVFIPLKVIFPDANIPIVQVSLHHSLDPQTHMKMGDILSPLRNENILIIGSGMSYHNLPYLFSGKETAYADQFHDWLTDTVTNPDISQRNQGLTNWLQAPGARSNHPREEHLLPLMVVAGAAGKDQGICILKDRIINKPIAGFQFG